MSLIISIIIDALLLFYFIKIYILVKKNIGIIRSHFDSEGHAIAEQSKSKYFSIRNIWAKLNSDTISQSLFLLFF